MLYTFDLHKLHVNYIPIKLREKSNLKKKKQLVLFFKKKERKYLTVWLLLVTWWPSHLSEDVC